jgi:hypothetical protein
MFRGHVQKFLEAEEFESVQIGGCIDARRPEIESAE